MIKIYTSVIQNGNKQTVEEFIEMYKSCSTPEEKERIALLLGEVRNPQLIEQVLNFAISVIILLNRQDLRQFLRRVLLK